MKKTNLLLATLLIIGPLSSIQSQDKFSKRKIANLKQEVSQLVEQDKKMTQVMIDKVFSFGELCGVGLLARVFAAAFETGFITCANKRAICCLPSLPSSRQ